MINFTTSILSCTADQGIHIIKGYWFISTGGKYSNKTFAGVIFKSDADKFKGLENLQGKKIEIKGRIKEYHGTPEIILNDPDQLKITSEK